MRPQKVLKSMWLILLPLGMLFSKGIDFTGEEFFASDYRITIDASITDEDGVVDARVYFKRSRTHKYRFFTPMKCKGKLCRGLIPAPHQNTQRIYYKILYKNGKKRLFSSEEYVMKQRELLALQGNQTKDNSPFVIKSELAKVPTLTGFVDNYSVAKVATKDKIGVLADLVSAKDAGVKNISKIDAQSFSGIGVDIPPYAAIGAVLLVLIL
jgi:hypothetical protein